MSLTLKLNGEPFQLEGEPYIINLLRQATIEGRFVVALNGELLPREDYEVKVLTAQDQVDILFPIAGG